MFESVSIAERPNWKLRITFVAVTLALIAGVLWLFQMTYMPLKSYAGPLPSMSHEQEELRERLSAHVKYLSVTIGERNIRRAGSLQKTVEYISDNLQSGGYSPTEQSYSLNGQSVSNIEAVLVGTETTKGTVIVGAHYDSVVGTVGADDNASGVAAVVELARRLQGSKLRRSVRFLFFVNEEPPYFQTENMGSVVYARELRHQDAQVSAMISLEMLGFYSDAQGSQRYPPVLGLFYPNRGDFIAFVGNTESRDLVRRSVRSFRETTCFPSEGLAAPADWPGVGWSDQWAFWQKSFPAIMITDTALFRSPHYHTPSDTTEKVDFEKAARVVDGVGRLIETLANEP